MGEVIVDTRFRNIVDVGAAQRCFIGADQVTVSHRPCLVNTDAVMVLLPEDEADKLGLMRGEQVIVTYADESKEELPTGMGLEVTVAGRTAVTDCVIGPPLCEPLIGRSSLKSWTCRWMLRGSG